METYLDCASMLGQVFSNYEMTDETIRRSTFNELLNSTIEQNKLIMGVFTAWKPNTIDSYDAKMGQYQTFYTRRRTGNVEIITSGYEDWQKYLAETTTHPVLADPVWRDIANFGNVPIISAQYPVLSSNGEVVGVVGINYVSTIQEIADELAKKNIRRRGSNRGIYHRRYHPRALRQRAGWQQYENPPHGNKSAGKRR
jgi:methyl-accepting chemotaxis protein